MPVLKEASSYTAILAGLIFLILSPIGELSRRSNSIYGGRKELLRQNHHYFSYSWSSLYIDLRSHGPPGNEIRMEHSLLTTPACCP